MAAIDYDLEFLEDGRTIELISIGMVADDGREYYAVNADMPVKRIRKHAWLMENVVPSLPRGHGDRRLHMPKRWLIDYCDPLVKSRKTIADGVAAFIQATPDVELWADYGAYDHVALCQLWGSMVALPNGVPMYTNDIQQEARRLGVGRDKLPKQGGSVHNALADARHNQTVRRWLAARAEA
ncbi:3'-5' exoribonuclease domain-containing protein [Streptomyces sp. DW26H14]|uniref:3'-5' exoribonuclease domain-containing protein n=1 Tax=Streptomyces sp. DW26H14 TaxID=3435395 RepID=UPI00403DC846